MKKFSEQLKKRADEIRMRTNERNELRERLLAYMEYHPLPQGQGVSVRKAPRRPVSVFINGWLIGRVAGSLAVLFLVVVPALAERSLPGEALYPVKVRFNEELRGALTSTPYQKVEWETERLERRLAEAQLLADAGKLTGPAEADVAEAIKQHSEAAKASINDIRANDSEEATLAEITLSSALEVQSELINQRDVASGNNAKSALATAVDAAKQSVSPKEGETISYNKLLGRLESDTTRAYEYLNTLNGSISAEERSDVERRLSDVKTRMEAVATLKTSDEGAASKQLAETLGSTRKIISFMTNLDVRRNVKIDDLVPAYESDEEKALALRAKLEEAADLTVAVETGFAKLATSSNDYLAVGDALDRFHESLAHASSSLASGDLNSADKSADEALGLVRELRNILITLGGVTTPNNSTSTKPSN